MAGSKRQPMLKLADRRRRWMSLIDRFFVGKHPPKRRAFLMIDSPIVGSASYNGGRHQGGLNRFSFQKKLRPLIY
jgi:hypothetical protein